MSFKSVCNICLAMDTSMRGISDSPLQDVYKKLTNNSFSTHRPLEACYLCYSQLRKCHNLMVRSVRADEVLSQILRPGAFKSKTQLSAMIKSEARQLIHSLDVTPIQVMSIVGTNQQMIAKELNEYPQRQCKEEMEIDSSVYGSLEELDNEDDEQAELYAGPDIDNDDWTFREDIKQELNTAVDADRMEHESAAPSSIRRRKRTDTDKVEDGTAFTPRRKKLSEEQKYSRHKKPRTRRTVITEEGPKKNSILMKTSDKVDNNKQIVKSTFMCTDTAITNCNVSDNDWTSTIDASNGDDDYLKNNNICNDRDDMMINSKCLLIDHNTEGQCEQTNGDESPRGNTTSLTKRINKTDIVKKSTKIIRVKNRLVCKICHKVISGKVKAHLKTHADEKPFMCEICAETFINKNLLTKHLKRHINERRFECDICQLEFMKKSTLKDHIIKDHMIKDHIRRRTREKLYKCDMCSHSFRSRSGIYSHMLTHRRERPFECIICQRKFYCKSILTSHLRTHTSERPFECDICQRRFSRKGTLGIHLRTHTGVKPHECGQCQRKFNTGSQLTLHLRTHTRDKPFECDVCQVRFARKVYLKTHLRIHTGEKPFICEICQRGFSRGSSLKTHLRIHSAAPSSIRRRKRTDTDKVEDGTTFTPRRKILSEEQKYSRHKKPRTRRTVITEEGPEKNSILMKTSDKVDNDKQIVKSTFMCTDTAITNCNVSDNDWTSTIDASNGDDDYLKNNNICNDRDDMMINSECLLIDHNTEGQCEQTNGDESPRGNTTSLTKRINKTGIVKKSTKIIRVKNRLVCKICHKVISGKVKAHLKTHADEKPFMCEICAETFKYKNLLTKHLKGHINERRFECDICQLEFMKKSTLKDHIIKDHMIKDHIRRRTREKPYKCDMCSHSFRSRSGIYSHMLTHLTHRRERPFECIICQRKFYCKGDLTKHLRTHTLERPYECDICQWRFSLKGSLDRHLRSHTGVKPHECGQCQRKFSTSNHLKLHLRIHTGYKPFECDVCQARFARKDYLKTHLRIHTGEKPFVCEICQRGFSQGSSLKTHLRIHSR